MTGQSTVTSPQTDQLKPRRSTARWTSPTALTYQSLTAASLPAGQSRPHLVFAAVPKYVRKRPHNQYLLNAVHSTKEEDSHVHLWSHLYNFANDLQWNAMKPGLNRIGNLQANDEIDVVPMRNLSNL